MSTITGTLSDQKQKLGIKQPSNPLLVKWVEETVELCQPDSVFWCDGAEEEKEALTQQAVDQGVLVRLNQEKLPGCYYHRSNSNDVARVEQFTYICTPTQEEAGPTNNWAPPAAYSPPSNSTDAARGEQSPSICPPTQEEAAPTNNGPPPADMYEKLRG